ncbi:MAG TPA: cytochrome d ubiquinol oxidase subunit II [Bacteroidales bacterium]|nr:cytochrome d ubiquinol oxidase subunit II [Bacteroidales bacterium]HOK73662.1 cytochrome d ubiquinol oxidase subunit II [Bacteroidales bacterium]HOM39342.1 cytochrome d ubiquinol oxidase subunit II [Bacteroidales bacterium]HOU30027.1 cytochrome d ubiquinol oxidase subunit II [Bacteroidales bacterium]HPP91450.1 cytochrome d ubiquinol oxidase subunit II [Bacteroidales bacterium]
MMSHAFLQHYWWIVISLLGGLLGFLMFVQGGQTFIYSLPANAMQRKMIVNALGRKWEFTFTTLVTFGGAFFASFPLFYATSFGGAYWLWMLILFSFVIQAVAYEYRSKPSNVLGSNTYDIFLLLNGSLGPFLTGIAVATFFTGAHFSLDNLNRVTWQTNLHGLEALADIRNIALGFALLFLARVNGLLFLLNTVDDEEIISKARNKVLFNALFFLVFFLYFILTIFLKEGFAVEPATGEILVQKFKYLKNLLQMPPVLIVFIAGVAGVLYGIYITVFAGSRKGIWFSGAGSVMAVFALFLTAGLNNTAFYPSVNDIQNSLTLQRASSSRFTLETMMYVSFIIPFVIAYIWYAWRAVTQRKITAEDIEKDGHAY